MKINMRVSIIRLFLPVLMFLCWAGSVSANGGQLPAIRGEAAILIDARTGAVVYDNNGDKRMYPASITKIVTGILALEDSNLADIVKVSKEARNEEGTRVFLAEGEEVPMEKLVYGLLVNSGNDAATAIAEHMDGSKEQFANRMNAFVKEKLGLTQTNFTNPHGLPDSNHYTTARDMAIIAKYAMENETFRTIVSTRNKPWVGKEWVSELVNHNKLLSSYEGATGIKNGYTNASGFTLVSSAQRGDTELIGVILKSSSSDEIYSDMAALLDYGFERVETIKIMDEGVEQNFSVNGEEKPFHSNAAIWMTAEKGTTPALAADESGNLYVRNSSLYKLDQSIASLRPLFLSEAPNLLEAAAEVEITPPIDKKSPWAIMVTIFWFLQLLFMLFVLLAKRRKRLTQKFRS
ncbi:D-alanyl-D-alanine carboxypeptidase [Cohnella herbarum]|uniref:D-alanyl-D-alanine carboxypeptidase n=2 Tax=Cohnella herbarum TaxID=2728023 RepID=A0A7Z2VH81_9BACL|nr:D-alanyl-D-alanine carboxypeptidase [Cohnella herbarum]